MEQVMKEVMKAQAAAKDGSHQRRKIITMSWPAYILYIVALGITFLYNGISFLLTVPYISFESLELAALAFFFVLKLVFYVELARLGLHADAEKQKSTLMKLFIMTSIGFTLLIPVCVLLYLSSKQPLSNSNEKHVSLKETLNLLVYAGIIFEVVVPLYALIPRWLYVRKLTTRKLKKY